MRIRSSCVVLTLLCSLCLVGITTPASAVNIFYPCLQESQEILLGEAVVEFHNPIRAIEGEQMVSVEVEAVLPSGWFWQICQVSTGTCYFNDFDITVDDHFLGDVLRVDFFPNTGETGVGYLNVTITSLTDPLDVRHCTYTVFNGVPELDPSFDIPCVENAEYAESGTTLIEFFSPITNTADFEDDIRVRLDTNFPAGWFGQFCQISTGVCYFDDATITIPAGVTDTLRVDFFPTSDGYAGIDLELFSESNPSFWRRCYYRADVGATSNVPDVMMSNATSPSWAQPNPFVQETDLRFQLEEAGLAKLAIYGADGRIVRDFGDVDTAAGESSVRWDGRDGYGTVVPAGVYFYRLKTANEEAKGLIVRSN